MAKNKGLRVERAVRIIGAPTRVLAAFFDARALAAWWGVLRSVTTPRPLGVYALEWGDGKGLDGGVFHGTVMEYRPGRELFVANAYWLPASGEALGPMGLEVTCRVDGPATQVRVRQSGADDGALWKRYQDDMTSGWGLSLDALKRYIEDGATPRRPAGDLPRRA
ncbi:MAG: SRPBCC domain-containing protein [Acidobacteria bacterium]|nr:SRPBCC domain-containing protein [Acidobacteriota bacterium]